jgi:hypothetical protein
MSPNQWIYGNPDCSSGSLRLRKKITRATTLFRISPPYLLTLFLNIFDRGVSS